MLSVGIVDIMALPIAHRTVLLSTVAVLGGQRKFTPSQGVEKGVPSAPHWVSSGCGEA